jgi:hypothetical protein
VAVAVAVAIATTYVIKLILVTLAAAVAAAQRHHTILQHTEQAVVVVLALRDKATTVHVVTLQLVTEPPVAADNLDLTVLAVVGVSLTQTATATDLHVADHMAVVAVVVALAKAVDGAAKALFESCGAQADRIRRLIPATYKIGELLNVY